MQTMAVAAQEHSTLQQRERRQEQRYAADLLRRAWAASGLTQDDIADGMDLSRTVVRRYLDEEHGATFRIGQLRPGGGEPQARLKLALALELAAEAGAVLSPVEDDARESVTVQRETAEALAAWLSGVAAGRWSRASATEAIRETDEAIQELLRVRGRLHQIVRDGVQPVRRSS